MGNQMTNGIRALLVVLGSAVLGAVYVSYLQTESFPAAGVRLVPIVWLAGAVVGGVLAARGLGRDTARGMAGLALALNIPNAVFAAVFSMAALMGD